MADIQLYPEETFSLEIALIQILAGKEPDSNISKMCVLALARLMNKHDWTDEACEMGQ